LELRTEKKRPVRPLFIKNSHPGTTPDSAFTPALEIRIRSNVGSKEEPA